MIKKTYFENLDGLRFLCFLTVFLYHSFHSEYKYITDTPFYHLLKRGILGNGNLGVNFFFVLSGFLITYLLIEEKKYNGQINLGKFWTRRILRIWPLYYLCVLFGFYGFPILKSLFGQIPNETANIWYYLFFINNFDFIEKGLPDASILGILWSIAIEEQFYLFWPIILSILPIKKYYQAFLIIIVSSLISRAIYDNPTFNENHSLSCMGDLAIGASGAWLISENKDFKQWITNLEKYKICFLYIAFLFLFFFRDELFLGNFVIRIFERSIIALFIILIILEQNYSINSLFKLSKFKAISNLGIISYGLYCYHFVGILIVTNLTKKIGFNTEIWQVYILETSLALIVTILISKLSYKYFEGPFLKLKDKFSFTSKI